MEYLGHEISSEGIKPKLNHVKNISNAPAPITKEQLSSFLGLTEFYSKFVQDYSSKVHALRILLKKNVKFVWGRDQQVAFEFLKKEIISAPFLKPFVICKECIVAVDASSVGLGAVLMQKN